MIRETVGLSQQFRPASAGKGIKMRKQSSPSNDGWDSWERLSDLEGTRTSPGTQASVGTQDSCVWARPNMRALGKRRRVTHNRWRRFGETVLAVIGTYLLLVAFASHI